MSRKIIPLDKLESTFQELFGLSDGENSEGGYQSDEREQEAIFTEVSQEDLENILDSPSSSHIAVNSHIPSVSRDSAIQDDNQSSYNNIGLRNDTPELETISDTEDDDEDSNDDWKKVLFPHKTPIVNFDDILVKPLQNFLNRSGPHTYFRLFFSEKILSIKVEQNNLYAAQNKQKNWMDVSVVEIVEYTKRIGGVDRFDQKRGTYQVARRSRRWWMRLFYFLVDAAITNAYILYAQGMRYPMRNLQFRTLLGRNLISSYSSRKKKISNLPSFVCKKPKLDSRQKAKYGLPDELRLTDVGSHLPGPLESYRRCRYCSSKENSNKSPL